MKKKITLLLIVIFIIAIISYNYLYKEHRNISSESASFSLSLKQLKNDFALNDSIANKKYLDKTISIYGKITSLDLSQNVIVIDSSLSAKFNSKLTLVKNSDKISIKGRFIGYDDLLEEYKMDQCEIQK
ncbi:hypothetical protein [Flavobacterium sp.]|uniref:OB-fold protein n=1 Tax=Flavobacterium sp. TaxID=239 RepID=UPI0037526C70